MIADFSKPQPHQAARALIAGKPPIAAATFYKLLPELRARAFTVSGVEDANVMQAVRDLVQGITEGATWDEAKKGITAALDPFLGDGAERRAEIVLRANGFQAFAVANYETAQADADTTHLQYLHGYAEVPTPSHEALHGVILPKDDPFWETHTGPWGHLGCVCTVRAINPDLLDEARLADATRAPDDKLVMEGPLAERLRQGQLERDGKSYSVAPPQGEDAFHFNPSDLRLNLLDIAKRYSTTVFYAFVDAAKQQPIGPGLSLWDWLQKEMAAPAAPASPRYTLPATPSNITRTVEEIQRAARLAGWHPDLVEDLKRMPKHLLEMFDARTFKPGGLIGMPQGNFALSRLTDSSKGRAFYRPTTGTVHMNPDSANWSGTIATMWHEIGHRAQYWLGVVNGNPVVPVHLEFAAAMKADKKVLDKVFKSVVPNWKKEWAGSVSAREQITDRIRDLYGFEKEGFFTLSLEKRKVIGQFADTVGGIYNGKYGWGHTVPYYKNINGGAAEAWANTFASLMTGDPVFQKHFPNMVAFARKTLKLPEI